MGGKGERWGTMSHEKGCVQNKRDDCPPSGMNGGEEMVAHWGWEPDFSGQRGEASHTGNHAQLCH